MAWTQSDVDRLKAAIASGKTMIRHGETSIQYASMEDMLKALALMQREVAAAAGSNASTTVATFRKSL